MTTRPIEKIVLFTVSTCGLSSDDLGADEKEICLLAWQVIDTAKIQVGINKRLHTSPCIMMKVLAHLIYSTCTCSYLLVKYKRINIWCKVEWSNLYFKY